MANISMEQLIDTLKHRVTVRVDRLTDGTERSPYEAGMIVGELCMAMEILRMLGERP